MSNYVAKAEPLTRNRLLASLSAQQLEQLFPKLERIELTPRRALYETGKPIEHVYFPEEGVVSLVSQMNDGVCIEIGTIGNEGMVGLPVFLGAVSTPHQAFAQVPGYALKMKSAAFKKEVANGVGLQQVLQRYTQALFSQLSQSVACNRLHSIRQRCARWLLLTSDRVKHGRFNLTQEFLAQMLLVRRASVNVVVQEFQREGMIAYKQGEMEIKDRRKLEGVSCECYDIVRQEYRKLIGIS